MTRQDHTFEDVRNLPLRKAIAVVNIWGPQKRERALERKRAADRNARRLERSRTKEHIARLEERIQLLLSAQDSSRSNITEKLLAENAALHERIHEYQKLVNSAKLTLENIQSRPGSSPQSASWARPEQAGEAQQSPSVPTDISPAADSPRPVDQPTVSALLNPIADANLEVHVGEYTNSITSSTAGADLLGHFFRSDYLPGARSVYLLHHPSPLAKTSIYRTSAALPDFHTNRIPPHLDLSAGHTVADVVAEEKLDTFYGTLLPIFSPGLMSLYQGLSDNIPGLNPASVLRDLLPNRTDSTTASLSQLPVPNCIALLKMSVAKYVAGTIREAQSNLEPDQRRSDTEM
ncbi:hypothetical protein A1O3_04444 [Capronia epimyces CBS 606.96]|uniref:BZIP domain-containing protein n=1 Tax=Capronia epimyces CBS 606.96 TaxID=1182542 RepID=W9YYW3_9EURO|nr:uncharacterized protein A1O3_04444 [Capronia epimyces CBS 606.96]EXJ87484.1 hypothetical protein A1O3_04444 [Capronia epimyces CBS 606.96]